jgi:hypothetical protein
MRWNRTWIQGGGWLLLLLFSWALGLPISWLAGALVVWVAFRIVRRLLRRSEGARASGRGEPVQGTVEPPTARHAYKPATTLAALVQALEDAGLGAVSAEGAEVRVALPEGEWALVTASEPEPITQRSLKLEGTSVQALALVCDAMARELGAMRLAVGGLAVEIDGTRPRGLLLNDVAAAVDAERRRVRAELRRLEREAPARGDGPGRYLN